MPGDFTLKLNRTLDQRPGMFVGTSDEQGAGFAADAYARLRGIGVVLVTWGVGGLKVVNPTAQAWAESVPVVVIAGSPGLAEREGDPLQRQPDITLINETYGWQPTVPLRDGLARMIAFFRDHESLG